jgi:shikimate kinase
MRDFINKHLFDRNFYYHQANKIVAIDNKSIAEIVDEISSLLA